MKKKNLKLFLSCLLLSMTMLLAGCGTNQADTNETEEANIEEELLADMKEFALVDGSASIYLDKDWDTQDSGIDNFLIAGDEYNAVYMFQFPKDGVFQIKTMEEMESYMDENLKISEKEQIEAFEVPGMSNVSVTTCKAESDGIVLDACLVYGETDYALYTIGYICGGAWDDEVIASFRVSCSKFAEAEEIAEAEDESTVELTDTVRWFNAANAVLAEVNGWDYNRFVGIPVNETTRKMGVMSLEQWWSVTDRASADENLEWVLNEGQRTDFAEYMKYFEEAGLGQAEDRKSFLLENFDLTEEEAELRLDWYEMYENYGENAIDGWDYCRALNLLTFYYLAGYYTEQEALDKSLEVAQIIQPMFASWDDFMASYLRGYEYWSEESSAEREGIYEDIKTREDNPYIIDFKMNLEKTW